METVVKITQFILSLSILIVFHEMGHFTFAKLFKTRVEKFYLFFDPWFSLFKFRKGDTEYGMGWLPLGGYVKISGMIDESMDKEQMSKPAQPWEFRAKPAYQRLLIMIGGVLVNFILALVIYSFVLYIWGTEYLPTQNVKYGITCDSLATDAGFMNGDNIMLVDGAEVENFLDLIPTILFNEAEVVTVNRDGKNLDIKLPKSLTRELVKSGGGGFFGVRIPFVADRFSDNSVALAAGVKAGDKLIAINNTELIYFDEYVAALPQFNNKDVVLTVLRDGQKLDFPVKFGDNAQVGIYPASPTDFVYKSISYTFMESIPAGIDKGLKTFTDYLKQFKLIFSKDVKGYESLGGFYTIGSIFPGVWNWYAFWNLTAFLSIVLGIMNILPIPALDGGHVMFLLYEVISGRKPNEKFMEYAQMAGMLLLLALLLYANGNDLMRFLNN